MINVPYVMLIQLDFASWIVFQFRIFQFLIQFTQEKPLRSAENKENLMNAIEVPNG